MASIYKRKFKDRKRFSWRAVVRVKGYPSVCYHFDRKEEAEDWAANVERLIKQGQFKFDQHKQQYTYGELVDRYIQDGSLEHHRSAKDTLRHLEYWKERLDAFGLVHLTIDRIGKERQWLAQSPSMLGKPRSAATINRYMASLSATLTYAARQLRWLGENPCLNLKKLKECSGRDRVLSKDEITRLLSASRQSKSPYLYCIIFLSLTTGARQGEILNLEWRHIDFFAYIKESKNGRPRSIPLCGMAERVP